MIAHLALADALGWLKKASAGKNGQGWRKHRYEPAIPPDVLKEGKHQRAEGESARTQEGAEPHAEGAEPDDNKVLNDVQSNSTVNSTYNSTLSCSPGGEPVSAFLIFWEAYPRKEHKAEALRIWARHRLDDQFPIILKDLKARMARCEQWCRDDGRFIPLPTKYLQGHLWHDKWAPPPRRSEYPRMRPPPKEARP